MPVSSAPSPDYSDRAALLGLASIRINSHRGNSPENNDGDPASKSPSSVVAGDFSTGTRSSVRFPVEKSPGGRAGVPCLSCTDELRKMGSVPHDLRVWGVHEGEGASMLANFRPFSRFSLENLRQLCFHADFRSFKRREVIGVQGAPQEQVVFILSGTVTRHVSVRGPPPKRPPAPNCAARRHHARPAVPAPPRAPASPHPRTSAPPRPRAICRRGRPAADGARDAAADRAALGAGGAPRAGAVPVGVARPLRLAARAARDADGRRRLVPLAPRVLLLLLPAARSARLARVVAECAPARYRRAEPRTMPRRAPRGSAALRGRFADSHADHARDARDAGGGHTDGSPRPPGPGTRRRCGAAAPQAPF